MSGLRVVLAGGGTGGHLYPGIAVAHRLQARCPGTEVTFVGLRHGLDERLVPREGFPLHTVPVRALTGDWELAGVDGSFTKLTNPILAASAGSMTCGSSNSFIALN